MARFVLGISLVILATQTLCSEQPPISATRVGRLHIEDYGVYNAATEISQKAHVPVGIDAISPGKEPTIAFDFPGGTVADLLNALVAKAPDYGWEETKEGVIHVFRRGAQVSLLDVVLSYPGAEKKRRFDIWQGLSKLPEISDWLKSHLCSRREYWFGKEFSWNNDPISIAPGTMTVRQLFDEVAVKSGSNTWVVLQEPPSEDSCHVALMLW